MSASDVSIDPILSALEGAERTASAAPVLIKSPADLIPYCKLLDPETLKVEPMQAWPHILSLLTFWATNKRTVTLKSRQMGASWAIALLALHHAGWNKYATVLVLNYNQTEAAKLLRKMKVLWLCLPLSIRPEVVGEWATDHVTFKNGSRVMALPVTENAGAGETPTLVVIDEAALIPNLAGVWPAISQGAEHGQIHLFSTPRGDSTFFAQVIGKARTGDSPFKFKLLNYREHPEKNPETDKGKAWVAARRAELSPDDFAREHECEFVRSGASYFHTGVITRICKGCIAPLQTLLNGRLKIFVPMKAWAPGENVGGADVAEGLDDGDFSAAAIMHRRSGVVLATYHARVSVTDYAEDLAKIGVLFGKIWWSIEANNHGHAVCMWLYKHLKYRNVYRESREAEGQIGAPSHTRLGVLTTAASKPAMLAVAEKGLRTGSIKVLDIGMAEELATFLCLPGGGYGAAPATHDDRVISLLLAQDGRSRPFPRSW